MLLGGTEKVLENGTRIRGWVAFKPCHVLGIKKDLAFKCCYDYGIFYFQ